MAGDKHTDDKENGGRPPAERAETGEKTHRHRAAEHSARTMNTAQRQTGAHQLNDLLILHKLAHDLLSLQPPAAADSVRASAGTAEQSSRQGQRQA